MAGEFGKLRHFRPFSRFDDELPILTHFPQKFTPLSQFFLVKSLRTGLQMFCDIFLCFCWLLENFILNTQCRSQKVFLSVTHNEHNERYDALGRHFGLVEMKTFNYRILTIIKTFFGSTFVHSQDHRETFSKAFIFQSFYFPYHFSFYRLCNPPGQSTGLGFKIRICTKVYESATVEKQSATYIREKLAWRISSTDAAGAGCASWKLGNTCFIFHSVSRKSNLFWLLKVLACQVETHVPMPHSSRMFPFQI